MAAFCTKVTYRTLGQPSAEQSLLEHRKLTDAEKHGRSEELHAAYQRIATLEADLHECLAYFEDKYDVVDTFDGEQGPNEEMKLGTMIQMTLYGPGNF